LIQDYPVAIQLRFLQTVVEIAAENNSTTVFPIPMDLFKPIVEAGERFKALGDLPSSTRAPATTLGGATSGIALPEGADQAMLAEAAKAFLGIGSGGSATEEPALPAAEPESDRDGAGEGERTGE
jgi:hypothetical protein